MRIEGEVYLMGDIHAQFDVIKEALHRGFLDGATLIQLGDFGIGFDARQEKREMESLNRALEKHQCKLLVIRGNHCDPSYYENTNKRTKFNQKYKQIELIKNQTLLEINGRSALVLNGAISIDRLQRVMGVSWWQDEELKVDFDKLEEVDMILSHTCPSKFIVGKHSLKWFTDKDPLLAGDLKVEREKMDKVLETCKPKDWFFGHFHESKKGSDEGCNWKCVDINEIIEIR